MRRSTSPSSALPPSVGTRPAGVRGQAIVFLLMALVILFFVLLWSADLHRFISVKDRSQNAGDAATLAAARWQATSLNLMGELNLLHALALAAGDAAAVDLVTNTQARLCYTGPMTAFAAAQQAAKLNGIPVHDEFTDFVRERAAVVRTGYAGNFGSNASAFVEPYPGAWSEYAAMIDAVAADGVAAGADNAVFYTDASGAHTLLDTGFYDAIAGRIWCWFHFHAPKLLTSYTSPSWWDPLPNLPRPHYANSEFFSLRLSPSLRPLRAVVGGHPDRLLGLAEDAGHPLPFPSAETNDYWNAESQVWYVYSGHEWGRWNTLDPPFPVKGHIRPEYDYEGADAVARVETSVERFTTGADGAGAGGDSVVWTAAGKPFGYLEPDGAKVVPNAYGLVLPAFRDVRLMPIDAATGGAGGSFKMAWRRHITEHLPDYLRRGTAACRPNCWYCRQLIVWENPVFRKNGAEWLRKNSDRCTVTGGGPGDSGGTQHAH